MYKKVHVNDEEVNFNYLSEPLNFNRMPKPYKEITMKEYFDQINLWHFTYDGAFQLFRDEARAVMDTDYVIDVFCCFNEDAGYARAVDYCTGTMKFFRIGCEHDYELIDSDYISNTYKCKKCGNVITTPNGR